MLAELACRLASPSLSCLIVPLCTSLNNWKLPSFSLFTRREHLFASLPHHETTEPPCLSRGKSSADRVRCEHFLAPGFQPVLESRPLWLLCRLTSPRCLQRGCCKSPRLCSSCCFIGLHRFQRQRPFPASETHFCLLQMH